MYTGVLSCLHFTHRIITSGTIRRGKSLKTSRLSSVHTSIWILPLEKGDNRFEVKSSSLDFQKKQFAIAFALPLADVKYLTVVTFQYPSQATREENNSSDDDDNYNYNNTPRYKCRSHRVSLRRNVTAFAKDSSADDILRHPRSEP